jgi:hypothetical protein
MEAPLVVTMAPRSAIAAAVLLLAASPAAAQMSLTLYGGYGGASGIENADSNASADVGSRAIFALSIGKDLDATRELQLQFSQQSTRLDPGGGAPPFDLTIRHPHIGATAFIDPPIGLGPYAVGGIGMTQFSPSASGYGSEARPSMNLGFGYHWPLTERVAWLAELRGYFTLVNSSGGFLCSGSCVAVLKGDLFFQYGALIGLTARH